MSQQRLKRIAALEARRPPQRPWTDPYPLCMQIIASIEATMAAEREGRPYSALPSPEPMPDTDAFVLAMRAADQMHARLEAERKGARQ
jgi:hypothetical protein